MKIALPVWGDRVSPVFDTAAYIIYADIEDNKVLTTEKINIESLTVFQRVDLLRKLSVDLFICGGITQSTLKNIHSKNLKTIPFICGNVNEILDAVLKNKDIRSLFSMPGQNYKENE